MYICDLLSALDDVVWMDGVKLTGCSLPRMQPEKVMTLKSHVSALGVVK